MHIASIGIDIGKTTFHLVALDPHGSIVIRRKFSRRALLAYTAKLATSLIGMETCGGAHYLARVIREQGHEVRLIPGQFVKSYRKSNKNDYLDGEAIAEAVTRNNVRFVPIKTDDQLDLQSLHRVRERLVHNRTEVINQMRGLLLERGLSFQRGPENLRQQLPGLLEDAEQHLTPKFRALLAHLWQQWQCLDTQVEGMDCDIKAVADSDAACRRRQVDTHLLQPSVAQQLQQQLGIALVGLLLARRRRPYPRRIGHPQLDATFRQPSLEPAGVSGRLHAHPYHLAPQIAVERLRLAVVS